MKANAALIEKGFTSTVKIADAGRPYSTDSFHTAMSGAFGLYMALLDGSERYSIIFFTGRSDQRVHGFDFCDIIPGFVHHAPALNKFLSDECEDLAASPLAYPGRSL